MRPVLMCLAVAGAVAVLAGCGAAEGQPPPAGPGAGPGAASAVPVQSARAQLAARAAAALDRAAVAFYTLTTPNREDRTITVVRAVDGGWRVDVPAAALGGTADVSVARTGAGLFQCGLRSAGRPERQTAPSSDFATPRRPLPRCVRIDQITDRTDPRVQHVFTDWLEVLTDRDAALAVTPAEQLDGVGGDCYAVEPSAAALLAPLDAGIYCYRPDGTLTGARLGFGTLVLAGDPAEAPPTVDLPGPVEDGDPLPTAAPPTPVTTPGPGTGAGASPAPTT